MFVRNRLDRDCKSSREVRKGSGKHRVKFGFRRNSRVLFNASFVFVFACDITALYVYFVRIFFSCFDNLLCSARFVIAESNGGRSVKVVVEIVDTEKIECLSYERVLVDFIFYFRFSEFVSYSGVFRNRKSVEMNENYRFGILDLFRNGSNDFFFKFDFCRLCVYLLFYLT